MVKTKPIIGITASFEDGFYKLYHTYSALICQAGGVPLILPYEFDDINALSGLILSGGGDVNPELANYEPSPLLDLATIERDRAEMCQFREAFAAKIPILGICRGHQVINLCLGGTLIRDLGEAGYAEVHADRAKYHIAYTDDNTLMRQMLGESMEVWSTHHQAVLLPGEGLSITARSPEGVVEGIEHENGLVLGMQTHPERMGMIAPFKWIVGLATYHASRVEI